MTRVEGLQDMLFISDLDGTLFGPEGKLSSRVINSLNRMIEKGLRFTAATARSPASAIPLLSALNLHEPVMLMNGVLIYDLQSARYLNVEAMSRESTSALIAAMRQHNLRGFLYLLDKDTMETHYEALENEILRAFYEKRVRNYNKRFTHTPDFMDLLNRGLQEKKIIYLTLKDTREHLSPIYEEIKSIPGVASEFYSDIYSAGCWYLECHSDRATKYNGARFIQKHSGAKKLVGFGDNLNDIPLFQACDECYAVANAREELKTIASGVIGSNAEDGVVAFLEKQVCDF